MTQEVVDLVSELSEDVDMGWLMSCDSMSKEEVKKRKTEIAKMSKEDRYELNVDERVKYIYALCDGDNEKLRHLAEEYAM